MNDEPNHTTREGERERQREAREKEGKDYRTIYTFYTYVFEHCQNFLTDGKTEAKRRSK